MLTYLFRAPAHWRPKTVKDLLNAKLVRIWIATPEYLTRLNTVEDFRDGRS